MRRSRNTDVQGTTAVEFALLLWVMVALLLGAVDLARWLAAAASMHEAARAGARLAVVCDLQDPDVARRAVDRLVGFASLATAPTLSVDAEPAGCPSAQCRRVRVTLSGAALNSLLPWWRSGLPLPGAQVELPRESLSSQLDGRSNPSCQ